MMPPELIIFLVAMSPIVELRGAIPLALKVYALPWWQAYGLAVLGNLVPLVIIVGLGRPISDFLSQNCSWSKRFFDWLFEKVRRKTEKLGRLGKDLTVVVLTALQIPFVGGWTGALAAFLLEVPAKRGIILVASGAIVAGLIVSALTFLFP